MKKNYWYKIFNNKYFFYKKKSNEVLFLKNKSYQKLSFSLCSIIYPKLTFKKFMNITRFQSNILKIRKNSSVLDFGSGNGAFLFYFLNKFKLNKNLSFEVSQPLISLQKKFINKTTFYKVHQSKDNFSEKYKKIRVDHSYCNSVFQYFVNENYALKVIEFLMNITNKSILIYDIKDNDKKNLYIQTVRKRQKLSLIEYKKKYKNTPIRFYNKTFFKKILNRLNKKYSLKYKFKNLPYSATDNKFGYCLIIYKDELI